MEVQLKLINFYHHVADAATFSLVDTVGFLIDDLSNLKSQTHVFLIKVNSTERDCNYRRRNSDTMCSELGITTTVSERK